MRRMSEYVLRPNRWLQPLLWHMAQPLRSISVWDGSDQYLEITKVLDREFGGWGDRRHVVGC